MKRLYIFACALLIAHASIFTFESDEESFVSVQVPDEIVAFKLITNNYTDEKTAIQYIQQDAKLVDMLVQAEEYDKDLQKLLSKLVFEKIGTAIIIARNTHEQKKRGLIKTATPSQPSSVAPLSAPRAPSGIIESPRAQDSNIPAEIITLRAQTNNYRDDEMAHAILLSNDQLFDIAINFAPSDKQLEQLLERLSQTDDIIAERLTMHRSMMPSRMATSPSLSRKSSRTPSPQPQLSREEMRRQQDMAYEEALKADREKERLKKEQALMQTQQPPEKKQRPAEVIQTQPTPPAEPAPAALTPQQLRELRAKRFGGN